MKIYLNEMSWIMKAATVKKDRDMLKYLHIRDNMLFATDGFRAHWLEIADDRSAYPDNGSYSVGALGQNEYYLTAVDCTPPDLRLCIEHGDYSEWLNFEHCKYKWHHKKDKDERAISFVRFCFDTDKIINPKYLADVAEHCYFDDIQFRTCDYRVHFKGGNLNALIMTCKK